ncbi:MAG: secretin N-terminal domain-containing protein, partial [Candidatus Babeliales bacterium]
PAVFNPAQKVQSRQPFAAKKDPKQTKTKPLSQVEQKQVDEPLDGHDFSEAKKHIPTRPKTATDDKEDLIEVNLEKTDLPNLLRWISDVFNVKFLSEDALQPSPSGRNLSGNAITFKTHTPLTKREVWDLFITFLDLFGFGLSEGTIPDLYKVLPTGPQGSPNLLSKAPLPSYINIPWQDLPDNDSTVRYVYLVKNSNLATIQGIVDAFRSNTSILRKLEDLNGLFMIDKSSNIRSIMQVVDELDKATQPEALSVLKLKNADANDVVNLYNQLVKTEDPRGIARFLGGKKPTTIYFPEGLRMIPEPRTNTLIILGDKEGIKKAEDFIINHVDTELKIPYSPLYVYELQYTSAKDMAEILTNVTQFTGGSAAAATSGGVREGDKYLRPMVFKAEDQGNRLLIKAEKEDYLKVRDIIRKLDVKQPQIAMEVLIVNVIQTNDRQLGVQIRNKSTNTVSKNLDFQTSGFPLANNTRSAPVIDQNTGSIMANLISLAQGQSVGSTLLTISNAASGVWGIFKILQNYAQTNIVSNPFLITTNKYTAQVSIGETRRIQTSTTSGVQNVAAFGDVEANLTVKITPQINSIGIINLVVDISIQNFTQADPNSATKDTKTVKTNANVANGEVLAIGGLLQSREDDATSKVPILGDFPVLGWFFKSKAKTKTKDNLLIFISPRIIEPMLAGGIGEYTQEKACKSKNIMGEARHPAEKRDPIHRWFFHDYPCEGTEYIDDFLASRNNEPVCRVECEECPDQIDPDYTCCGEPATRFITTDAAVGTDAKKNSPAPKEKVILADNKAENKKSKKSLINFLPGEA